jgi:hypothetical protein
MINREQFLKVYKPVNKLTNIMQWFHIGIGKIICLSIYSICFILMQFFCIGYWGTWHVIGKISFLLFTTMFPIGLLTIIAILINNYRIKKICKLLKVEIKQFKIYEDMYIKKASN